MPRPAAVVELLQVIEKRLAKVGPQTVLAVLETVVEVSQVEPGEARSDIGLSFGIYFLRRLSAGIQDSTLPPLDEMPWGEDIPG